MPESTTCIFIKKETLAQVFSCELCEISKNTFCYRTPPVAASDITLFFLIFRLPFITFININTVKILEFSFITEKLQRKNNMEKKNISQNFRILEILISYYQTHHEHFK